MIDAWKTFLLQQGAVYHNDGQSDWPEHFGNPQLERVAARDADVITDLSSLTLLRVRGADAKTFLNAQLTNEIDTLDANQHRLAAWCTAQGRMLAVFRVFMRDGDYCLQLPVSLRDEVIKRLRMFVLRSRVTVECVDTELVRLGISGPSAEALVRGAVGQVPPSDDTVVTQGSITALCLPGVHPRFELIAPLAEAMAIWEASESKAVPVGAGIWAWFDILAGLPTVLPPTKEMFVPQMANLELVGGVNFKKGCYPGQEIVARMQYLGKLKQRMVRAHVSAEAPVAGTPVFSPDMPGGQSAGTVVDAQPSADGGADLLVVAQIASVQRGELHLASEVGPLLQIQPLPYSLDLPQ